MSSPPRLVNTGLLAGAQDLLFGISVVSSQPNQAPAGVAQPAFEPAGADATAAWREQLWTHPGRTQIPPPPPGGDGPLAEAVVVHDGAAAGGGADLPSAQAAAPIDASLHITWATGHETAAPPRLAGPGAAVTAVPPLADVVYHVDDYANPDSIATAAPTAASQASGGGGGGPDAAADAAWGLAGTAPPRAGSVGLRTAAVLVGDRGRLELVRTAHGVWVVAFASGAVGAAGCAAGDRLVRVGNNTDVSGMTDAASLTLALERAARPVRLELLRPGVGFSVEVTSSGGPLGLGLVEDMAGAALVYSVEAGGQAARGGVCPCDVVVGADELVFGASGVLGVQASLLALRRPFRLHLLRPSTLGRKCTLAAAAASAGLPRAVADDLLTRVVADDLSTTMPTTSAASSTAANGSSGTTTSSHPRPDSWETELEAALADGHHLPRTFGPKTVYLVRHAESVANRTLKSAWACAAPFHACRVGFDSPLTPHGRAQLHAVRPAARTLLPRLDAVLHSPLARAGETARVLFGDDEPTASPSSVPRPRFVSLRALREKRPEEWAESASSCGGASARLRARAAAVTAFLDKTPFRTVAIVGHSKFLRAMLGTTTKIGNAEIWAATLTPGAPPRWSTARRIHGPSLLAASAPPRSVSAPPRPAAAKKRKEKKKSEDTAPAANNDEQPVSTESTGAEPSALALRAPEPVAPERPSAASSAGAGVDGDEDDSGAGGTGGGSMSTGTGGHSTGTGENSTGTGGHSTTSTARTAGTGGTGAASTGTATVAATTTTTTTSGGGNGKRRRPPVRRRPPQPQGGSAAAATSTPQTTA